MQNRYYATKEAYLEALADALRLEYEAIVGHGFLLQLDCPDLALERHVTYQDRPLAEFLGFVERVVAAISRALVNLPRERVRMHVCWGNYEGPHDLDVPLAAVLPIIRQANVGGFAFPFANPRHAHEYRCFEGGVLADDQILVAGVIDPLTNFVEHPEVVAKRIERVAATVGHPRRVLAGTDCGFDTSAGIGRVTEDVVWPSSRRSPTAPVSPRTGCSSSPLLMLAQQPHEPDRRWHGAQPGTGCGGAAAPGLEPPEVGRACPGTRGSACPRPDAPHPGLSRRPYGQTPPDM
jgi:hypothetical protein